MLSASRVLRSSASQAVRAASASGAISAGPSISTASIVPRTKETTEIFGINVHPSPLTELRETYKSTLSTLNALPEGTVYRQATEALTSHRLSVIENALSQNKTINEDVIKSVEDKLDVGLIEEVVMQANDELGLVAKMIDWKASEPLEHPPPAGQWKYFDMREEAGEGDEIK
ncbi:unnamed protein product [Tilletia controversa]|uniref:NADH dehydrogenase [ubiquinone] 1 alpha subcomplex subunit 5 n=3 Tax=Tilletia TaxID=13289 RepID=A0A8X7N0A1_9BASI|nr:hypothetical protein CF328_g681 [Tilletia controversa]KAE8207713.1 hypothetical protein CF335_g950 [Tilletia laevis]KAE8264311.1 hypothetical protein A4X03_0g1035 [Tilletia caries]KAE8254077.1 hypothetical protein A4X06_0g1075 [Tilletia controversa]CAD6885216.1 unnamed protein product [Tilletia caries]